LPHVIPTLDGVPTTLDLFQGQDAKSGKFTGKGLAFQTFAKDEGLAGFKAVSFLDVKDSPDKKGLSVSMYAAYDPTVLFSTFTITQETRTSWKYLRLTTVKYGGRLTAELFNPGNLVLPNHLIMKNLSPHFLWTLRAKAHFENVCQKYDPSGQSRFLTHSFIFPGFE